MVKIDNLKKQPKRKNFLRNLALIGSTLSFAGGFLLGFYDDSDLSANINPSENIIREEFKKEITPIKKETYPLEKITRSIETISLNNLEKIIQTEKSPKYLENNDFANDSEKTLLARVIYGEARGELDNKPYIEGMVLASIMTRAERTGKSLREIILEKRENKWGRMTSHYTCFDPLDKNFLKLIDPLNSGEGNKDSRQKVWEECNDISEEALKLRANGFEFEKITNYFVSKNSPEDCETPEQAKEKGIPGWAFEREEDGDFKYGDDKKIILLPYKIVKLNNGETAYALNLKYF